MPTTIVASVALCFGLFLAVAASSQQKLEDRVRASDGSIEVILHRQVPPAALPDLVAQADLIVRALVVAGRSRLTTDEREIETDYTFHVREIYGGSRDVDVRQAITVAKPGRQLTLAGRVVLMREPDFPAFEDDREYVLFLRPDQQRSVSLVVGGSQGAFLIEDGYAGQVNGEIKGLRGKLPLDAFKEEIRNLAAKK